MATRKAGSKSGVKSSKKSAAKASAKGGGKALDLAALRSGTHVMYGIVIHQAIARGDAREMQQVATIARKWLRDVQTALNALDRRIEKSSAK